MRHVAHHHSRVCCCAIASERRSRGALKTRLRRGVARATRAARAWLGAGFWAVRGEPKRHDETSNKTSKGEVLFFCALAWAASASVCVCLCVYVCVCVCVCAYASASLSWLNQSQQRSPCVSVRPLSASLPWNCVCGGRNSRRASPFAWMSTASILRNENTEIRRHQPARRWPVTL